MKGFCTATAIGVLGILVLRPEPRAQAASGEEISRGRYIAQHVAMCVQCHSPRDSAGDPIPTRLFHGAPIPVRSPFAAQDWAFRAPHIAGLPGYTREQAVRLLMEGVTASGGTPRPPMPPFRMKREDAEAVAAFLKSLQ
jgi:mono/diheme cytochrome c family protein